MNKTCTILVSLVVLFSVQSLSHAGDALLTQVQEVPPTSAGNAIGTGTFTLNPAQTELTFDITTFRGTEAAIFQVCRGSAAFVNGVSEHSFSPTPCRFLV